MEPNNVTFIKETVKRPHSMAPIRIFLVAVALLLIKIMPFTESANVQVQEMEVLRTSWTVSLLNEHYVSVFGFGFVMNNFGFGVGGEYRKVVARQTELTASLRITGLRDASEQTFTDFFWGQQAIPNKYQRAMAFPLIHRKSVV